jgi:hypothetical protein
VPRFADGTPAHGVPRFPDGTPAHGTPTPEVRGGHPEQRETGGGWGAFAGDAAAGAAAGAGLPQGAPPPAPRGAPNGPPRPRIPGQRPERGPGAPAEAGARPAHLNLPDPGPRRAYLDAFEEVDDVHEPGRAHRVAQASRVETGPWADEETAADAPGPGKVKGAKGRTFTGIAAAAVTTVLAVIVAGQVTEDRDGPTVQSQAADDSARDARDDSASRSDQRPTPAETPSATPLSYDQKMAGKYTLAADLEGDGRFETVRGFDEAPGKGQKYRYRVDVEKGLGLDAELFAEAVQKTLNDDRSWAHNGGRTFERISSGQPDFVITLASPGTTATWCAKSGLDTTVDNVSCDSASTDRVMINAYRWAQGSETYGDQMHAYRQMLINHEIGHRLGYDHVTCDKNGELAPVMQQQTKFLNHNGIRCKANPWPFPGS